MKKYLIIFGIIFLTACSSSKRVVYVPTQTETKIEYRDTTIHIRDTIRVEIPKEVIKEVMMIKDTSRLETSIAYSEAFIDTLDRKLHHTLINKETALKGKLDTIVRVQYVNEYIEVPIIKEVEVEKPYIPKIGWLCIIFTCCWAVVKIAKIIWKLRK